MCVKKWMYSTVNRQIESSAVETKAAKSVKRTDVCRKQFIKIISIQPLSKQNYCSIFWLDPCQLNVFFLRPWTHEKIQFLSNSVLFSSFCDLISSPRADCTKCSYNQRQSDSIIKRRRRPILSVSCGHWVIRHSEIRAGSTQLVTGQDHVWTNTIFFTILKYA